MGHMSKEDFQFFFYDLKGLLLKNDDLAKAKTRQSFIDCAIDIISKEVKKRFDAPEFELLTKDESKVSTDIFAIKFKDGSPIVYTFFDSKFSLYILDSHLVNIYNEGYYVKPKFLEGDE